MKTIAVARYQLIRRRRAARVASPASPSSAEVGSGTAGAAMLTTAGGFQLHGIIASLDGTQVVRGSIAVDPNDPVGAGQSLAAQLYADGGMHILAALRAPS